ncbi:MAG: polysaccharide pyruvyl transferase family protein [Microthrixaceae bacterium]
MTPASPRILVSGWNGAGNLGDELIGSALVELLEARGAEVAMFSKDPDSTQALHGVRAFPNWSVLPARRWADGVVLGPGGVLQDQTSAISCAAHVARHALVGARRARSGIGLGVGPIDHWPSRCSLRHAQRGSPAWVVRDAPSAAQLKRLGFGDVPVAPDLAHLALPPPRPPSDPRPVTRVLLAPRGTDAGASHLVEQLCRAIEDSGILDRLPLRLVAMTPEDHAINAVVASRLTPTVDTTGRLTLAQPSLAEAGSIVAPGDYAVSGRFHLGLMAQHAGNHWTAIDSGHKMRTYAAASGAPTVSEDASGITAALSTVPAGYEPNPRVPSEHAFAPIRKALDDLVTRAARRRAG